MMLTARLMCSVVSSRGQLTGGAPPKWVMWGLVLVTSHAGAWRPSCWCSAGFGSREQGLRASLLPTLLLVWWAQVLSKQCNEHAAQLSASFEAPLREFVRLVKSAKATMSDRSLALAALQHARGDVDAKRTNLMKLRGTPGIRVRICQLSLPCIVDHVSSTCRALSGCVVRRTLPPMCC